MGKIVGKFTKIIFSNPATNFYVLTFKLEAQQQEAKANLQIGQKTNWITVIETKNDFQLGITYELDLLIKESAKYGLSYVVANKTIIYKNSQENAINFLASKLFFGIGPASAKKVVEACGLALLEEPQKFEKQLVQLVGSKSAKVIIDGILDQSLFQELYKKFIDENLSMSILNYLELLLEQQEIKAFLEEKPFDLIELINGIDFIELNQVAKAFCKTYSLEMEQNALVLWIILQLEEQGSTIIPVEAIWEKTNQYLELSVEQFNKIIAQLLNKNKIIAHPNQKNYSSMQIFQKEKLIAQRLKNLHQKKQHKIKTTLETKNLDAVQTNALKQALEKPFSIITGAPGTGKTLLIDLIMVNLEQEGFTKIELLAPTGKAATQISAKTAHNAKTIHSFLKYNKIGFDVNEQFPADTEVIIIDEFSMINIHTFYAVLIATPRLKKLILIGDKNQLPSIGPGYLLNDLLASKLFLVSTLEKIYRQDAGSNIIHNALMINQMQYPIFNDGETKLMTVVDADQAYTMIGAILKWYLEHNPDFTKQQILIPMYAGKAGIDNINLLAQKIFQGQKPVLFQTNNKFFYEDDKVIQLENDNDKNVFNGEIGYIKAVEINAKKEIEQIHIRFENKLITYTLSEFNQAVQLAYAISIHKFQGSECQDVLLVLLREHLHMLTKKLVYTAYTRGVATVIVLSNKVVLKAAIENDADSQRIGNLLSLLSAH